MYYKDGDFEVGRPKPEKHAVKKPVVIFFIVILALDFIITGAGTALKLVGKNHLKNNVSTPAMDTEQVSTEEGVVYHNGCKYKYNPNIYTVLCMGIDTTQEESLASAGTRHAGQSDANFLVAIDSKKNIMKVIAIPRDTMTSIGEYDYYGNYIDEATDHLALQYAYGGGGDNSCKLMKETISKLMYQLPIHAYISLDMDAISVLNDMVGGVTVNVLENLTFDDPMLTEGAVVTLNSDQAYWYVRERDCEEDYSAQKRLLRQKQYVTEYIYQAKKKIRTDLSLPVKMYGELEKNMVTDISVDEASYLASILNDCSFKDENFYIIPGTDKEGDIYDEYIPDDEGIYEMVLEVFYENVSSTE